MAGIRAWATAHRKLVVFAAGAALTVAIQIWGTSNPYVSLGILIATGAGVYQAPNIPAANPARTGHARLVTAPPPPGPDPGPPATLRRKP